MCQKKYDIDSSLMEKLDYVLSLSRKEIKKLDHDPKANPSPTVATCSCILVYVWGPHNFFGEHFLKAEGMSEGAEKVVKALKAKSLRLQGKEKGKSVLDWFSLKQLHIVLETD
ncbi:hypothetical protein SO802_028790 [Lithocarpus litseifolius]|uniref:Uncharacterized protein n=1 Tax=Lithocarpus litseifolius TaxID=425828 RepID=A0AAW2BRP0_9ROSI